MSIAETSRASSDQSGRFPLSHTQNFLRLFDQGDDAGPFSARYNIVVGWRIRGRIDVETLQGAMDDVVARHDSLRTLISRGEGVGYQEIHPPTSPTLWVRDLPASEQDERQLRTEELLRDIEAGSYDAHELPHLRAVLARFDEQDSLFVLIVHHTSSDGWSMQLLVRDIAIYYARRKGLPAPDFPPMRAYQEYARWQHDNTTDESLEFSRDYWRQKLDGAEILAITTDQPRSANLEKVSPVHRFVIPEELTAATLALAKSMRSSPFMVLLAAYNVLLHRMTDATDLVVPTLTSGRNEPQFQETVGPFFNFIPLRTDISGCETFREVADRTRMTCLEAYSYDIPFPQILGEAPTLMAPLAEDRLAACAFQVWQFSTVMERELIGDLELSEVRGRTLSQHNGTDIPDGALFTLDIDPSGRIFGNLAYNNNLFDETSMVALAAGFSELLGKVVPVPDAPLKDI